MTPGALVCKELCWQTFLFAQKGHPLPFFPLLANLLFGAASHLCGWPPGH